MGVKTGRTANSGPTACDFQLVLHINELKTNPQTNADIKKRRQRQRPARVHSEKKEKNKTNGTNLWAASSALLTFIIYAICYEKKRNAFCNSLLACRFCVVIFSVARFSGMACITKVISNMVPLYNVDKFLPSVCHQPHRAFQRRVKQNTVEYRRYPHHWAHGNSTVEQQPTTIIFMNNFSLIKLCVCTQFRCEAVWMLDLFRAGHSNYLFLRLTTATTIHQLADSKNTPPHLFLPFFFCSIFLAEHQAVPMSRSSHRSHTRSKTNLNFLS